MNFQLDNDTGKIIVHVPINFRRWGGKKVLIGPQGEDLRILEKEIPNRINSFEVNDSTFVDVKKIENIEYISENKNQILLKVTDEKQNQLKVNFSKTKTE